MWALVMQERIMFYYIIADSIIPGRRPVKRAAAE
jgi:hypothetical protein